MSLPKLFTPVKVGAVTLQHRVVLAPLTRVRANKNHVHSDLAVEYYKQRGSTRGTLLITEATFIAPQAGGILNAPGIYSDEQIAAWKKVCNSACEHFARQNLTILFFGRLPTLYMLKGHLSTCNCGPLAVLLFPMCSTMKGLILTYRLRTCLSLASRFRRVH